MGKWEALEYKAKERETKGRGKWEEELELEYPTKGRETKRNGVIEIVRIQRREKLSEKRWGNG